MKSYAADVSDDDLVVIVSGADKPTTIVIPIADHEALARAIEELLNATYLDGRAEGRERPPSATTNS
jgi:hypothetical protein